MPQSGIIRLRRAKFGATGNTMKLSLLLCGAVLMAAGCASPPNPFTSSAEQYYNYDLEPQPFPDLTPAAIEQLYGGSIVTSAGALTPSGLNKEYSGY
jgi:hypothetical protein